MGCYRNYSRMLNSESAVDNERVICYYEYRRDVSTLEATGVSIEVQSKRLQEILVYIRRILGWSAVTLGEKLGVSRQSVNKIESGKSGMSKTEYLLLRRILDDVLQDDQNDMLPIILEILVDNPEKYTDEQRNEVRSKMKLVAPTVISDFNERNNVSNAWKSILIASGIITAGAIAYILNKKK